MRLRRLALSLKDFFWESVFFCTEVFLGRGLGFPSVALAFCKKAKGEEGTASVAGLPSVSGNWADSV